MQSTTEESSGDALGRAGEPEHVVPPWQTLVLVCGKCKGARRGPDARAIRKHLKHRVGKDRLRVIESECMSVCPEDAVTVCCATHASGPVAVQLVRSSRELDALGDQLAASLLSRA